MKIEVAYLMRLQRDVAIWHYQAWEAGQLASFYNFFLIFESIAKAVDWRVKNKALPPGIIGEIIKNLTEIIGKENCSDLFEKAEKDFSRIHPEYNFKTLRD